MVLVTACIGVYTISNETSATIVGRLRIMTGDVSEESNLIVSGHARVCSFKVVIYVCSLDHLIKVSRHTIKDLLRLRICIDPFVASSHDPRRALH